MHASSSLSPSITTYLSDYVTRSRRVAVMRSAGFGATAFLGWMIAWCLTDRWVHLPPSARATGLAAGVCLTIGLVIRPLIGLRRQADWIAAAAAVERENPRFAQRLVTVTSRLLGSADYRGSDEILHRLVREVDEQVAASRTSRLRPTGRAAAPWLLSLLLVLLLVGLTRVPDLRFGRLARRFLQPASDLPPVTTTHLAVTPGDCDVTQSQPLRIEADVARLGNSAVTLFINDDDRHWSRAAMAAAAAPGHFAFLLAAVERDLRYYVTAGDARSAEYHVRSLRKPAVAQFKIRYVYPPYTLLQPATVANADGHIEAPVGTEAYLTVTATEPLQSALLTIGGEKILMSRTGDERSRTARLLVQRDGNYLLDLISTREVPGGGPGIMTIRAVPDLPPRVRLGQAADGLRLNPRDLVPLSYDALDDYGIRALSVRAQVNAANSVDVPLRVRGDARRQEDTFEFNLSTLPLNVGDVLTLTVAAIDTAGHRSESEPVRILVSPKSVDPAAHQRVAELHSAAQLADELSRQFEAASKAQDDTDAHKDRRSQGYLSSSVRGDRDLTAAAQTATLLRQALLRAVTDSDAPQLSVALAGAVDEAEAGSAAADDAFRQSGAPSGMGNTARDKLRRVVDQSRQLRDRLKALADGAHADVLLRDREDLGAVAEQPVPADPKAAQRRQETLERARAETDAGIKLLGLDPGAGNVDEQLRGKAQAAQTIVAVAPPVDLAAAAREWAQAMQRDPQERTGLEGRLSAAAQAQAIRPDADLLRARDLELASRAAAALTAAARAGAKSIGPKVLDDFAAEVAAVSQPHEENQPAAQQARQELAKWAGDPEANASASGHPTAASAPAPPDRQREAEQLAMQASALAVQRQYSRATAMDRALARKLAENRRRDSSLSAGPATTAEAPAPADHIDRHREAVEQSMSSAERLDDLRRRQEQIARRTADQQAPHANELAGMEESIAGEIARVQKPQRQGSDDPTWRDRAAAELLHAEEQLSALPRKLADAQAAASADAAHGMAERLGPFAPEATPARAAIEQKLVPALRALAQAAKAGDQSVADRAAADARQAIETSERELASAQDAIAQRDLLAAAKWYARAAADSLTLKPPDFARARAHQQKVAAALSRAWDQSIRRAAAERLAQLPTLQTVLNPATPPTDGNKSATANAGKFTAAREWGRVRFADTPDAVAPLHETDPAGYEEAIKLYFQAIGKAEGR